MVSGYFPGGYNVKLYISSGRLAWWLLAFLCCGSFFVETVLEWNHLDECVAHLNMINLNVKYIAAAKQIERQIPR